jgi:hypothetical protein
MGRLWSTLALVAVLAGLGGYIFFVDAKKSSSSVAEKQKVFEGLQADKLQELTLTNDGETSTLKKADGTWKMTAPTASDADQNEVSTLSSNLVNAEINRVIDENASNLADYGLANPKIKIGYKAEGGGSGDLLIGEKTATQGDVYAMKPGTKRVFLISSFQETAFGKKPFDLRDKKVLNFERDKVDSIEIADAGAAPIQLARSGSTWAIKQPVQARADYSAVEGLLTRLSSANMTKLVEPTADAAALAKYGLDKPPVTVTLGAGSARASISLGKEEDGATYARDQSRPMVFSVDQALVGDLKKQIADYRDKELFAFRSFNAAKVRIVRGTDVYQFQKVSGSGDNPADKWQRVNAGGSPTDVDTTKMEDLLTKLTNLRAQSFAGEKDKTGLDKPDLVVSASFDQGKFERVRFAKPAADAFAAREGDPGAAKLDATAYDDANKALTELVTPPPSPLK